MISRHPYQVATTASGAPATTVAPVPAVSPDAANHAVTTASACRNSTDPACVPFRFDPQPGVFHVTLRDPDGVSYGASTFFFGESGIANSTIGESKKYGRWDPPAHDRERATVGTVTVVVN